MWKNLQLIIQKKMTPHAVLSDPRDLLWFVGMVTSAPSLNSCRGNLFLCRQRRWCWRCRTRKQEWSRSLRDWLSQQYRMLLLVNRTHSHKQTLTNAHVRRCTLDVIQQLAEWLRLHSLTGGYQSSRLNLESYRFNLHDNPVVLESERGKK